GEATPVDPGCAMVRLSEVPPVGAVVVGAVVVNERAPRLPELRPRPARASASLATRTRAVRMANTATTGRNRRTCIMGSLPCAFAASLYWYFSGVFEVPFWIMPGGRDVSPRALRAGIFRYVGGCGGGAGPARAFRHGGFRGLAQWLARGRGGESAPRFCRAPGAPPAPQP